MIKKWFLIAVHSALLSVPLFAVAIFSSMMLFGVEWAFTDIEYNRFATWIGENWKHPVKLYYICLAVGFAASCWFSKYVDFEG